jgi:ParB family chromosome partitioning protein
MRRGDPEDEERERQDLEDENTPVFLQAQRAVMGVFAYLNHQGGLHVEEGYIVPDDLQAAIEAGEIEDPNKKLTSIGQGAGQTEEYEFPKALMTDMNTIRTGALQTALLDNHSLCYDLMVFALSQSIPDHIMPVKISAGQYKNEMEDHGQNLPEAIQQGANHRPRLGSEEAALAFEQFRQLKPEDKIAILTNAVARSVAAHVTTPTQQIPFVELLAHTVNLDVRKTWTPNSTFLNRLKSAQLDEIMAYILDRQPAKSFTGAKKGDKVARLHALFNNETDRRGYSDAEKERIQNWTPDCLTNRYQALEEIQDQDKPLAARVIN